MKIKYTKWVYENPKTKNRTYTYVPIISLFLIGNHKVGKSTKCYLDSGSIFNIFPTEYATALLGFSEKSLKKGVSIKILGVGGMETKGYGHKCNVQHPNFELKDVLIFFVNNQPYPLLGRTGFMDQFKKIVFDEENRHLELIN